MTARDDSIASFRAEVLRLRSVLVDRTTELPAYGLFVDELRGMLERRRQIGVLHVEIADLDLVESLYGWQIFDRILARAASVLRSAIGTALPGGTLLAINGAGGDRFVLFVPETDLGALVGAAYLDGCAERVRRLLEEAFAGDEFDGLSPRLRFRAGHALLTESPFYRFERRVHAAVEEARTLPSRRESLREDSRETDLRRVIEEAAISTLFQPVVDLETGTVLGFEALARGPKDTILELPSALFAISSRFGLNRQLDRLCRTSALRGARDLAERRKLFVNVLPGTLLDPEWQGDEVRALLTQAALGPADLVVEVSERDADLDLEAAVEGCTRMRREGFGLALDDVGTGYATLGTVAAIRPDYLKMDASLVRGIHANLIKQELLSSLVQIGRRMGADVIAEGVETADETAALRTLGARYGQGFHFARPAPAPPASSRAKPEKGEA